MGDLGQELTTGQIEAIGSIDILLCPVGGMHTLSPELAMKVTRSLEPSIVIPMHYKTARHDKKMYEELAPVEDFVKAFGREVTPVDKLEISRTIILDKKLKSKQDIIIFYH